MGVPKPTVPTLLQSRIDASAYVCGSDECGLGSWAGPLSVCAVIVPCGWNLPGVTDSKKLTRTARERVYPELIRQVHCLVHVEPQEFDATGAGQVLLQAHQRAVVGALTRHREQGGTSEPLCIIDGIRPIPGATALPKADQLIPAVSAASIIAKVTHDWAMDALDQKFPGYGFAKNAGYGTAVHRAALDQLGVSQAHRRTYQPMKDMARR